MEAAVREIRGFPRSFRGCILSLAGFCLIASMSAIASGEEAGADNAPAGRVARLTFTDGFVHVDRLGAGQTAGDPAQLNMPLTEGQTITTGENGQAEVEFEDGSVVRLTPNSALSLNRMTVDGGGNFNTELGLMKGQGYFELRSAPKFTYRVDAGGDVISPVENATVRVVLDEPPAAVAVLDGTAHVERADSYRTDVVAGETFRSDISSNGRYFLTQEIAPDSWDQWNEERDQAAADAAPKQTAARDGYSGSQGYGWSDLDANGNWYDVPGQGQVWQPEGGADANFDPYGNGSWVWYQGGGYQWASGYSWGWTPFRCGGWSYWDTFGWGWSPNAACGLYGFAGYGGYGYGGYGGYVNVVLPPRRYPIHRPTGGSGGVHPIIPVHNNPGVLRPVARPQPGTLRIAGAVATPLRPIGAGYTARGGSAVGASLRRDFPVDRATRTPVMGLQPTRQAASSGFVSGSVSGVNRGYTPSTMRPVAPQGYGAGVRPGGQQSGYSASQSGQGYARPGGQPAQMQRAPQQSFSHPSYSAPAASHSSYSAPAASYSAPAASHSAPASSGGGGGKK